MKKITILFLTIFAAILICAQPAQPVPAKVTDKHEFSTAGFFRIENGGRKYTILMWAGVLLKELQTKRSYRILMIQAEVVNTPHGLEYLPDEASGGINYRGEACYRKHFIVPG